MVREDIMLVWRAQQRVNGGNVHNATNLIRSYQMAVEMATSQRCKNKPAAREYYMRCDTALRQFAG